MILKLHEEDSLYGIDKLINSDYITYPVYSQNIKKLTGKFGIDKESLNYCFDSNIIAGNYKEIFANHPLTEQIELYNTYQIDSMDCICMINGEYEHQELIYAYIYAIYTGKRLLLVDAFEKLIELSHQSTLRSVMLIRPVDKVELKEHIEMSRLLESLQISCVPYKNKFDLNYFIAKLIVYRNEKADGKHIVINRVSVKEDVEERRNNGDEDFYYFPKPYCVFDNLNAILFKSGRISEFNYLSHGRECFLFLNDFLLCGSECGYIDIKKLDKYKHIPCCYYDNNDCVASRKKKYYVSDVNADIVFLNGCKLGDLDRSIIPYDYSIVSNMVNNSAISIIVSPTIKVGSIAENVLAHGLTMNGYTEGEKVNLVNRFLQYSGIEDSLYFLIGDCCLKWKEKSNSRKVLQIKKEGYGGTNTIELSQLKDSTFAEVSLEGLEEGKDIFVEDVFIKQKLSELDAQSIFYFIDRNSKKLFMFSIRPFPFDSIRFALCYENKKHQRAEKLKDYICNIAFYKNNFALSNALKGQIQDIQNNFKTIYPLYKDCNYKLNSVVKLNYTIDRLLHKVSKIYDDIFNSVWEYTSSKRDNYYEMISEKRLPVMNVPKGGSPCICCGREARVYHYILPTFERDFHRTAGKCMSCGTITDFPDKLLLIESNAEPKFSLEDSVGEVLKLANKHDYDIEVNIAPICLHTGDIEIIPQKTTVRMKPEEEHTFSFMFKPGEALKKQYYLFAFYIMADSKFYFYSKMISYI